MQVEYRIRTPEEIQHLTEKDLSTFTHGQCGDEVNHQNGNPWNYERSTPPQRFTDADSLGKFLREQAQLAWNNHQAVVVEDGPHNPSVIVRVYHGGAALSNSICTAMFS